MTAMAALICWLLFLGFVLILGRYVDANGGLPPTLAWFVHRLDGVKFWHIFAVLGTLAVVYTMPPPGFLLAGLCLLLLVLYVRAWLLEFFFLMGLTDNAFPGRFDKLTWALVLIFLGPLGLWAFRRYHTAQWPETTAEPRLSAKPVMPRDWA
jgi:hypothetical protein